MKIDPLLSKIIWDNIRNSERCNSIDGQTLRCKNIKFPLRKQQKLKSIFHRFCFTVLQMHFTNYFLAWTFFHVPDIFISQLYNEVKWSSFLYAKSHNFKHYLEHIEMQKVLELMTIGLSSERDFLLPSTIIQTHDHFKDYCLA